MSHLLPIPQGWTLQGPILFAENAGRSQQAEAYRAADGCQQRERSLSPLQASYYDVTGYRQVLETLCRAMPASAGVVDLGCGDGRFSKLVLSMLPDAHVIAVDFNPKDLLRLHEAMDASERDRATLVCASVSDDFPWEGFADAVILSEVAYTLNDPLDAYRAAWRCLKPGGLAMVSNVAKQAYFVHALLNGDWQQVERIVCEDKYVDIVCGQSEHRVEVHLYDTARMIRDAEASGFEVVECRALPAEPSLLLHAMRARHGLDDDKVDLLAKAATHSAGIERIHISLLRKAV